MEEKDHEEVEMKCIACESQNIKLIEKIDTEIFIDKVVDERKSDSKLMERIRNKLPNCYKIYQCNCCGLNISEPMKGGTAEFYDIVYEFMPKTDKRWEFGEFKKSNTGKRKFNTTAFLCPQRVVFGNPAKQEA